jgi:hypothetical protein
MRVSAKPAEGTVWTLAKPSLVDERMEHDLEARVGKRARLGTHNLAAPALGARNWSMADWRSAAFGVAVEVEIAALALRPPFPCTGMNFVGGKDPV